MTELTPTQVKVLSRLVETACYTSVFTFPGRGSSFRALERRGLVWRIKKWKMIGLTPKGREALADYTERTNHA